jgi:hypothetical protein
MLLTISKFLHHIECDFKIKTKSSIKQINGVGYLLILHVVVLAFFIGKLLPKREMKNEK